MPVLALTGVTGFIGRALLERLVADSRPRDSGPESSGHDRDSSDATPHSCPDRAELEVRVLVRGRGRLSGAMADRVTRIDGDLDDSDALTELVEGADAVVHLAGAIAGSRAEDFDRVNVEGSRRLVEAIHDRAPGAHAILISSLAAEHPELSWYAASKAGAERVWQALPSERRSILRPPAVYGPGDPALADFWKALARGWLIRLGPRDARFSLVHVDDVVEAIDRLAGHGPTGTALTLAGPAPDGGWRWADIAALAAGLRGGPVRTVPVPAAVLGAAGAAGLAVQRLRGRRALLSPGKVRELRHIDWVCDNLALSAHLDWTPQRALADALPTLPGWNHP
ncbi:NAD-dependent epimerase/dehydratase family protein [Halomonas denitrificans]|nr:NAD-dependent epimerase/dehydratase family protein [Halomonas denitrificans]